MKYYGGKHKIGEEISNIILNWCIRNEIDTSKYTYMEPFCGSLSVMKRIIDRNSFKNYEAYDINKDLILLFKALKKHEIPLNLKISKKQYLELKNSKKHSPLRAIAGILYSFSGGWFNSYCPTSGDRNYVKEGYKSLNSMIPIIKKIKFESKDYRTLSPKNCIIYCDPPYKNTCQKYNIKDDFDTEEFWNIMRLWSSRSNNNIVFVSELHAPSDFKCIWKKSYSSNVNYHGTSDRVEKLFVHSS